MSESREGRRDVALTTLIDLLVQVVFVFTLLLIASGGIDGTPEERGYANPEVWKTLVSIFDVDVKKNTSEQAEEIAAKYKAAIDERDSLRKRIDELDQLNAKLEKRTGGTGLPPCRTPERDEIVVVLAKIDSSGRIATTPLPGARSAEASGLTFGAGERSLSRDQFRKVFTPWRERGMSKDPQCQFGARVEYDPRALAGDFQPSIAVIATIFKVRKLSRQEAR
jgi:hypothetical protein